MTSSCATKARPTGPQATSKKHLAKGAGRLAKRSKTSVKRSVGKSVTAPHGVREIGPCFHVQEAHDEQQDSGILCDSSIRMYRNSRRTDPDLDDVGSVEHYA